jgi:CubicO group peptidase (beta-lactamase class C family)
MDQYIIKVAIVAFTSLVSYGADSPAASLPRTSPESQGVSSVRLLDFVGALDRLDTMNSFMLVRHGRVVAEGWWTPYERSASHELYSLSKSVVSTAIGIAVSEGKVGINDEVLKYFPEEAPSEPSANLKAMRIRDLLRMSTGQENGVPSDPDKISAKAFLANPVPHTPGTYFHYDNAAAFMLSAIIQKQTGQTAQEYLRPRLFEPLGIAQPFWGTNYQGISLGAYGLRGRTEDIAKLGQLYLQKGKWNGKQLIPAAWVEASTSLQTATGSDPNNDFSQGYGFFFWRARHGAYFAAGWAGQYCLVLPEQDTVVAITGALLDTPFDVIWEHLLPAFESHPLPRDAASRKNLEAKLGTLSLHGPEGATASPAVSKFCRKFVFPTNDQKLESISLSTNSTDTGMTLVMRSNGIENRLNLGFGTWNRSRGGLASLVGATGNADQPLAASAAWTSEDTLAVKVCAYETPFCFNFTLRFDGDRLIRDWRPNLSFGDVKRTQLIGRAE